MGDVADLTAKAYEIARLIPAGHVTTYGEYCCPLLPQQTALS